MSSFPIKVSGELYDRIRQRAEEEQTTMKNALIEMLAEPHPKTLELEKKLAQTQEELEGYKKALAQAQQQISELTGTANDLRFGTEKLERKHSKDIEALNSWKSEWNKISGLEKRIDELWEWSDRVDQKLDKLQKDSHHHLGQKIFKGR